MKIRNILLSLSLVSFAGASFGASPVATITSSSTFELRGAAVRTEGIPSWPVLAGDEIRTSSSSALIRFTDGSHATIGANSQAKVENSSSGLVLRLQNGNMQIVAAPSSSITYYNGSTSVAAKPLISTSISTTGLASDVKTTSKANRGTPPPPLAPVSYR